MQHHPSTGSVLAALDLMPFYTVANTYSVLLPCTVLNEPRKAVILAGC